MIGTRVEIIGENSTFLQHVCPRWIGEKGVVVAITQDRIGSLYQVQLDSGRKFESINGPIDPYFRDYEMRTAAGLPSDVDNNHMPQSTDYNCGTELGNQQESHGG